ncbi:MAG TPA: response regulator [Phycisphaerae bacterium]|jgi:DNA-binding response OmpR family regulator
MSAKVLVVEDDLEINELLGEYLALENIAYLSAESGQAGVHLAKTQHPDAVILDLMLPDIDGYQVAQELASHRETHNIPIIILSCLCQDCDKEKGFHSGALFYMNKPFLPDDLLQTVGDALEWRAVLQTRVPEGELTLGPGGGGGRKSEETFCSRAINQLIADVFSRTVLSDEAVMQIREGLDMLAAWEGQWQKEHKAAPTHLRLHYRITDTDSPKNAGIEWTLTEDAPGMLADAFFKVAAPVTQGPVAGAAGALLGWGASTFLNKPPTIAATATSVVSVKWLELLTKTGAPRFERDVRSHAIRFTRPASGPVINAAPASLGAVPVVDREFMPVAEPAMART